MLQGARWNCNTVITMSSDSDCLIYASLRGEIPEGKALLYKLKLGGSRRVVFRAQCVASTDFMYPASEFAVKAGQKVRSRGMVCLSFGS
jgi:hypothetical protein